MSAAHETPVNVAALHSDALHRALAASGDAHCWLLLDPTVRPLGDDEPLGQALAEAAGEIVRVPSPHPNIDSAFMPQLVRLDSARPADSAVLRSSIDEAVAECAPESLKQGSARRIGGWLQTQASGEALARHIGRQMVHRRSDGRSTLLRWTDPAVLWALWPLLALPEQKRAVLGPITTHHLLDPAGRCVALSPPPSSAVRSTFVEPRLVIADAQWPQLDAIGPLNQALLQVGAARLDASSLNTAGAAGMAALMRARALGFVNTSDLAAFASRAMALHPTFDAHPLVAERLAKRQPGDFFTALVDSLDESDWSRIANQPRAQTRY